MTDSFTWVEASLQQLKAQTGLVQVPRAQLEGHPVAEAGVALARHHTAALRLHHLSVNLQAHLDTHTCREHTRCVTAADAGWDRAAAADLRLGASAGRGPSGPPQRGAAEPDCSIRKSAHHQVLKTERGHRC